MSGTLAILRRELAERRALLAAAAVAGFLPLAAPFLPGVRADAAADARELLAVIFAVAVGGGIAVIHGAGMVARDLRERRFGFYFARPAAGTAIWAGKLLAGLLLALGAATLALLPAAVAAPSFLARLGGPVLAVAVVATLLLLGSAHLVAVALASRSRLLALDLVALPVLAGVFVLLLRRLATTGVMDLVTAAIVGVAAVVLGLVLVAGWAQVVFGRCDAVRGHRIQASLLWGGLAAAALILGGAVTFVVTVTPASLRSVDDVVSGDQGSWVAVSGPVAWRGGYRPAFLLDTASGRSLNLPDWRRYRLLLALSDDGHHAVWLRPVDPGRHGPWELMAVDLSTAEPRPRSTRIFVDGPWPTVPCLSRDGSHLATVEEGQRRQVAVYRLSDGRLVATALLPSGGNVWLHFVDDTQLRVEAWRPLDQPPDWTHGELTVGTLDLADGRFATTARVEMHLASSWYRPRDPAGRRMLLVHQAGDQRQLVLHDAWSGAPLATLASWQEKERFRVALFLADGRIAVASSEAVRGRLHLFGPAGEPLGELDLGPARWVKPVSEVAPGRLLVGLSLGEGWGPGPSRLDEAAVVDLAAGTVLRLGPGRVPVRGWWWQLYNRPPAPGSLASRLLVSPHGALELFDPATDTCRRLVGRD